jgi:hypothetical protein
MNRSFEKLKMFSVSFSYFPCRTSKGACNWLAVYQFDEPNYSGVLAIFSMIADFRHNFVNIGTEVA